MKHYFRTLQACLSGLCILFWCSHSMAQSAAMKGEPIRYFEEISGDGIKKLSISRKLPKSFRVAKIDLAGFRQELLKAPAERPQAPISSYGSLIKLPMQDGSSLSFRVADIPVMADWEKYPEIKTYTGQCVEKPSFTIKMDVTPLGFHAAVFGDDDIVIIDPIELKSNVVMVYAFSDYPKSEDFHCIVSGDHKGEKPDNNMDKAMVTSLGTERREYRLALATNTNFVTFYGGTKALAFAAATTKVNRLNGIYERDFAIRLNLISNSLSLMGLFTDNLYISGSSPDTHHTIVAALGGESGFDVGHYLGVVNVDADGVSGNADVGVVCGGRKGAGFSQADLGAIETPKTDFFLFPHEVGHMFGATHTFNSSCGGGRASQTAFEPGTGNSIMSYWYQACEHVVNEGGLVPFFHSGSWGQVSNFTTTGGGGYGCAVKVATGNSAPTASAGTNYYVPRSTPLILVGSSSDAAADLNALTTSWDQVDEGPITAPASPSGNSPLFRMRPPTNDKFRYLPALSSVLSNTTTVGEALPSYGRRFRMQMMVRDNRAGGGATRFDSSSYYVVGTAGPFAITAPTSVTSITENTNLTVSWNRANTHLSPISTANVSISLSVDGGTNFFNILSSTPNDGSQTILIPAGSKSNTARIKISALGNIYFAVSQNLIINGGAVCYPPAGYSSCNAGEFGLYPINNFSIENSAGTVTLMSNLNTGCPASGSYSDYAGDVGRRPQLLKSSTYRLKAQTCTGTGCLGTVFGYYIDINGDGFFDGSGEYIGGTMVNTTTLTTFNWTVPATLADGFYRIRVKSAWNVTPQAGEACNPISNGGEVEDYLIFVSFSCGPSYVIGCSQGDVISKVTLGSFSNNTGPACPNQNQSGAYNVFTGPAVFTNSIYNLSINAGTSFTQQVGVWIDFNDNLSFADPGEFVYGSTTAANSFTGTISIPNNPLFTGPRRMRVRTQRGDAGSWQANEACGTRTYGETEDYYIPIINLNRGVIASGNQTICNGGTPSPIGYSTLPSAAVSLSYMWYYQNGLVSAPTGNDLTGWTSTGVTTQSYSPPAGLTTTRSFACLVTPSGGAAGWTSGVRQVTVLPAINPGTLTSGDETFCNSGNPAIITMSTFPSGSGSFTYKWYYKETATGVCPTGTSTAGWIATAGTANSYDPASAGTVANGGRTFALFITPIASGSIPACGVAQWASGCRKTVVNNCTGFTQGVLASANQSICNGGDPGNITFSTSPTTGSTYLWYYKAGLIAAPANTDPIGSWLPVTPSATGSTFDPPSGLTASRTFACRVTNGANNQWASGVRQVTVLPVVNYGTLAAGNQTIPSGSVPNAISFSSPPSGGSGTFGVIWYYQDGISTPPAGSWISTGSTVFTFTPPALTVTRSYAALVIPTGTPVCGPVEWASGARQIIVNTVSFTPGALASGDQTICSGGNPNNIAFSTAATAGSTYLWFYQDGLIPAPAASAPTTGWNSLGVTTSSYDPPSGLAASRTIACRVTNGANSQWASGVRQVTALVFNPGTIASGDQSLCSNGNPAPISLSVAPSGSGSFTYQWYYKNAVVACPTGNATAGWTPVSTGGNTATYDPASANTTGRTFVLLVTPGGTPTCGVAAFANSCRKVTVIPSPCSSSRPSIGIDVEEMKGDSPDLLQNVPNPFTSETVISCVVPEGSTSAKVEILGMDGRKLTEVLLNATGYQEITLKRESLPSGMYMYSLNLNGQRVMIRKMVVSQ